MIIAFFFDIDLRIDDDVTMIASTCFDYVRQPMIRDAFRLLH